MKITICKAGRFSARVRAYPRTVALESQGSKVLEIPWESIPGLTDALIDALAERGAWSAERGEAFEMESFPEDVRKAVGARIRVLRSLRIR